VGPRAGLDAEAGRKILCPCLGSNPGGPVRGQTLYLLSYPGFSIIIVIIITIYSECIKPSSSSSLFNDAFSASQTI
jgi:hypothetical protein